MTDTPGWLRLGDVAIPRLNDTRLQVHHAVQAIAAFGQTFLAAQPDDSHRSMTWDPGDRRFWSPPADDGSRVAVSLDPLAVHVVAGDGRSRSLRLMGTTMGTLRAWLEQSVPQVTGWDPAQISWPDYDLPEHGVTTGDPFELAPRAERSLIAWYSNALALIGETVDGDPGASPIRVWPHHFDIASLVAVGAEWSGEGHPERAVGVGLSPGDGTYEEPYFYVTVWPHPDPEALEELDGPGYWHTKDWIGRVLKASALTALGDDAAQEEGTRRFVAAGYAEATRILTEGVASSDSGAGDAVSDGEEGADESE